MGSKHYRDRRRQMVGYGAGATVIPDSSSQAILAKSFAQVYSGVPVALRSLPQGEYTAAVYQRIGDGNLKRVDEQPSRMPRRDIVEKVSGLEKDQVLVILSTRVETARKPSRVQRRYSE